MMAHVGLEIMIPAWSGLPTSQLMFTVRFVLSASRQTSQLAQASDENVSTFCWVSAVLIEGWRARPAQTHLQLKPLLRSAEANRSKPGHCLRSWWGEQSATGWKFEFKDNGLHIY